MSDEKNIENVSAQPEAPAASMASEDKPKRRPGRPRKTKAADQKSAEAAEDTKPEKAAKPKRAAKSVKTAESAEAEEKLAKRRGRPRKTVDTGAVASTSAVAESSEVLQARALAQISQASVVRRQRRQAERAAEMLSSTDAAISAAPKAQASEPASIAEASDAPATAQVADVDSAPRPKRRGRKPKAVADDEKAALAAQQAAILEAARVAHEAEAAGSKPAEQVESADDSVSPASAEQAEVVDQFAESEKTEGAEATEASGRKPRRTHQKRADAEHTEASESTEHAADESSAKAGKDGRAAEKHERVDRTTKNRERRERQQAKRKERNNRYIPTEPTLTREELEGMKVAELREKGKELELDVTGKKKAELVEEIYAAAARAEGFRDVEGILDMDNQGFGYIRVHGYMPSRDDAFVPAPLVRAAGLRPGDYIAGTLRPMRPNDKLPGLGKLRSVNGMAPEDIKRRPKFADLTPIYPNEPLVMEHGKDSITGRAIDIVSPIGKGQRGLIVSPPKAGKTTILKKICQSIAINNPEVHLICLLVDERPEEVTDMQRSIKGDVVASTFDMPADNHTRVSELVIERAKRIVEMGGDVVVVLDSITRLARAYNLAAPASGRILSGGVDSAALYPPKRFLGAARNIENGGSLTILASALIDTGSKMDEVIFEEFKGTGNMELKLDRELADRRIFPAIDPVASGTRNEDLLISEQMRPFVWGIRRILAGMNNTERAAASFIKGLKGTNSNQEFLIRTAKKAADHPDLM